MAEMHAFVPNPWGRNECDAKVDDDGRVRLCGLPAGEHEVAALSIELGDYRKLYEDEKAANVRQQERIHDLHKVHADTLARLAEETNKSGRLAAENTRLTEAVRSTADDLEKLGRESGFRRDEYTRPDQYQLRAYYEGKAAGLATAVGYVRALLPASDNLTNCSPAREP